MPSIAGPGQASSQSDAWSPITTGGHATSNNEAASIDPFSPVAQKELSEFDLLRNEIESTKISNIGGENIYNFLHWEFGSESCNAIFKIKCFFISNPLCLCNMQF